MKRTFITAITFSCFLGAMVGCAKNDLIKESASGGQMSFSTYLPTKGEAKTDFIIGDKFGVMATESPVAWSNTDAVWFMGGGTDQYQVVSNNQVGNTTEWKYSPIKIWPESNSVSFFAFSPVPNDVTDFGISNVTATTGSPILDFAVNDDIKKQVDLLRAEALDKFSEDVQLSFGHALSRVTFAARADVSPVQKVRLDKIELTGIKNSGKLKIYDEGRSIGSLTDMGGWSGQTGSASYVPALTHEVASLVPTTLVSMTLDDQALFMIPQEFSVGGDAKLEVTYSYSNDDGKQWVNGSKFEIDLGEYTQYWNAGKSYRYVLTLSPANDYTFTATIVDWDPELGIIAKNPFSTPAMSTDPIGGTPEEITVFETQGKPMGYTLKSNVDWITITDKADGTNAAKEVEYKPDGTVTTKAYEMEKKWYIKTTKNETGAIRNGFIEIIRDKVDVVKMTVAQPGIAPFVAATPANLNSKANVGDVYEVKGLAVPVIPGLIHRLKTTANWYTISADGKGRGTNDLVVSSANTSFFVHIKSSFDGTASRAVNLTFETSNAAGDKATFGTYAVGQVTGSGRLVGSFAGDLVSELAENGEIHYYYNKLLISTSTDETGNYKWQDAASATNIRDKWDGKGNTAKLVALGGTPAATQCYNKASTPANEWYLPAINQLMGMYIAKPALGTFGNEYSWSSTEASNTNAWYVYFSNGVTRSTGSKTSVSIVRCVRESINESTVTLKVIKDVNGKVYIDVAGMPAGTWSDKTLNVAHNEESAANSLFKRFEVDKSDKPKATQAAPGCSSGWRLPTRSELYLMCIMKDVLVQVGVDAFATTGSYWSSTEYRNNSSYVWYVTFTTGFMDANNKTATYNVRCIREVN